MTLIVSFVVNTSFRSAPLPPTPTFPASNNLWGLFGSHNTTALSIRTSTSVAVIPASLKHAPAAYERGSTLATVSSALTLSRTPASISTDGTVSKVQTWSEKMKTSTDVILRSPSTLSETSIQGPTQVSTSASSIVAQSTTHSVLSTSSLSIRLVDSISEIVDATKKAILVIVPNDMKELADALDALMQAIRHQINTVFEESKSTVQLLRDELQYRNNRAKGKARELREKSEQIILLASDRLKRKTAKAKTQATNIKEGIVTSEAWRTYSKAHGQWVSKLRKGDREMRSRHANLKRRDRDAFKRARGRAQNLKKLFVTVF